MTSATSLFQLLLSPLLSRSAMAFFLLLFFLCTVLFFKSRGRPTLHLVSGLLALVCLIYGLFILFLVFAFGHSDGSLTELSGEVVEWSTDGDTSLSSFVVQTEEGDRFGVLMTGQAIVLPSDTLSAEDFLRQPPEGVVVSVFCQRGRQTLTAQDGRTLAAFSADQISIIGQVTQNVFALSDGTEIDLIQYDSSPFASNIYRLRDGKQLLRELPPSGPENVSVGGVASFDDLSPAAQEAVSAYYDRQGLLYDIKQQVETAYQDYRTNPDFRPFYVERTVSPSAASSRVIYFLTTVTLLSNDGSGTELRLGDAFDRETGARLDPLSLFSISPEQVPEALVSLSKPESPTLKAEMIAAFQPDHLVFLPDGLEINFPLGTLPSQEYDYIAALDYTPQLTALLQSWAIPLDN